MRHIPGNDINLGQLAGGNATLPFPREARRTHLYVCGSTGTGKSKFLEHLIRQDIKAWRKSKCGMLVIDPHGSLYDSLTRWLAWNKLDRPIVPIDLRSKEWSISYNVLRPREEADTAVLINNFVQAMAYVWGESDTKNTPLFARWAGNVLTALYEKEQTLLEAEHLVDRMANQLRYMLTANLSARSVGQDWAFANALSPRDFELQISSTVNRLRTFLATQMLRRMFGQGGASLDLGKALEDGSIILVSLATEGARVSEEDGALFATLLLSDLWAAAKDRGKGTDQRDMKPFYVYIDEFQNFITPTIAKNLDQARGFGLHLTLANQFPRQILHAGAHGAEVYDSVMGSALSKVVFETHGKENLEALAFELFMGTMDPDKIKHELYSTKVMGYREELKVIHSESVSSGTTFGSQHGAAAGTGIGGTVTDEGASISSSEFASTSESENETQSESTTRSKSVVPTLVPILGKELSQVQYQPLDEQIFRAMAVLHDQKQRHAVAKVVGEKVPVTIVTPTIDKLPGSKELTRGYLNGCYEKLPFALPIVQAQKQLDDRQLHLTEGLAKAMVDDVTTAKRRIRRASPPSSSPPQT